MRPPKVGIYINGKDRVGRFFKTSYDYIYLFGRTVVGRFEFEKKVTLKHEIPSK